MAKPSGVRVSEERWARSEHDTRTDITRRFVPAEEDPTVRASAEFTEALLSAQGYPRRPSATAPNRPRSHQAPRADLEDADWENEPSISTTAVHVDWPDEPSIPTTVTAGPHWADESSVTTDVHSHWHDDPSISTTLDELMADDPSMLNRVVALRGDAADDPTIVDGWAHVPRLRGLDDTSDPDFDRAVAAKWPTPRIPAEFAPTTPPFGSRHRSTRSLLIRTAQVIAAGVLLTSTSFLVARANYDPAFRAQVTDRARSLWHAASARVAVVVHGEPATASPPSKAAAPSPSPVPTAASPAPVVNSAEPALRVFQIDELPLAPDCESPHCQ